MKFVTKLLAPMACVAGLVLGGCQPAGTDSSTPAVSQIDGHDHENENHDHPKTLKEAVQSLSDLYAKIKPAFENKDPDAAHGELHDVAHLLDEAFPDLIQQDGSLDEESKTKLTGAVNTLFDAFSKLDGVLHGGPDVEFPDVDSSIAKAMEELKGLVP